VGGRLDPVGEGVVELAGFVLADAERDFDSGGAEASDAGAGDKGMGSPVAATTRWMPASMRASAQGPVRPWWLQGSRVT